MFRPPWWAWILCLAGVAFFSTLAHWQWQRGQDKADIIARRAQSAQGEAEAARRARELPGFGQRIEVHGQWQPQHEILLDNQTHERQVGVHVWTPLRLAGDGALLLVNRGWLPASLYRDQWPDTGELPAGRVQLRGLWRDLPRAGLAAPAGECQIAEQWPQRLSYPSAETLRCLFGTPVLPGLLLLDAEHPDGFVRDWGALGIPPERHYGYAFQWAALGLTVLGLFLFLNFKDRVDA